MNEEIQSFCARVIQLCHYVQDANTLTDFQTLKDKAVAVQQEAEAISAVVIPAGRAPL